MAPKQRLLFSKRKESTRPEVKGGSTSRPQEKGSTAVKKKEAAATTTKTVVKSPQNTTKTEALISPPATKTEALVSEIVAPTAKVVASEPTASDNETAKGETAEKTGETAAVETNKEASGVETKREDTKEETKASSVAPLSGTTMDSQRPVSVAVDFGLDDEDEEDDDASMADEASANVWNAYQRWRVTKTRLSGIPPNRQHDTSLMSNISTS